MKNSVISLSVLACVFLASDVFAGGEMQKEDLSACKLPHGELVIPDRNAPAGREGYILRFSDGKLNPSPWKAGEKPGSTAGFLARIAAEKTGDFIYSSINSGSLISVSGRAADLGEKLLYELSGRTFERPKPVASKEERSGSGQATPGVIDGIQDGHCYLIETPGGKCALVRVVQKRGRLALIQYVYQPSGAIRFDIPKGDITQVPPQPGSVSTVPLPPVSIPGKATDTKTLLVFRQQMISRLIDVVKRPAKTPQEIMAKSEAVLNLGQLRANEAAPVLVKEISFRNPLAVMSESSIEGMYPAIGGLVSIGKPGSLASLAAIGQTQLGKEGEEAIKAKLRLHLLALVIRGVEGVDVGEFMVKSKMEKAPAKARASYEYVLTKIRAQ